LRVIKEIVEDVRQAGWGDGKTWAFHAFNEPTIDPRLYWLVNHVRKQLPGINVLLFTNGWYLDPSIGDELIAAGVKKITLMIYDKQDYRRLEAWATATPEVEPTKPHLSKWVLQSSPPKRTWACFAPLVDLTIRASGNLGLCCQDYAEEKNFGNLNDDRLPVLLERHREEMEQLYFDLRKGVRTLPRCIRCHRRRPNRGRWGGGKHK
jgi:2-deoxy-scyllo-inosamine dehydrogenase (SAM-dependent)